MQFNFIRSKFSALLPRNCDDVFSAGFSDPGTYIIDVDGSGPLLETYAYCENGQTIVPHNMPNYTEIKSKDFGNAEMTINYK